MNKTMGKFTMEDKIKIEKFISSCDICLHSELETSFIGDLGKTYLMLLTFTEIEVTEAYVDSMRVCNDCSDALKKITLFRRSVVQNWSLDQKETIKSQLTRERKAPECCICFENKKELCSIGDLQTIVNIVFLDAEVQLPQKSLMKEKCCVKCISSLKDIFKLRNLVIEMISQQFIEEVKIFKEEVSDNKPFIAGDSEESEYGENRFNLKEYDSENEFIENIYNDHITIKIEQKKTKNHMKYTHGSNEKENFICDVCEMGFPSKLILIRHLNRSHNNKWQYCPFCMKKYASPQGLPGHLVRVHKLPKLEFVLPKAKSRGGYLKCHICTLVCTTKNELYLHYKKKHERRQAEARKSTKCDKCNKVFKTWTGLIIHKRRGHNKRAQKMSTIDSYCEECDLQFQNPAALKTHRMYTVLHAGKKFKCSLCGDRFRRKHLLKEHMQFVHGNQRAECPICDKDYKNELTRHLRRKHDLPNLKNADEGGICDICSYASQTSEEFYQHFREIHSDISIKCNECEKVFGSKYTLNLHKQWYHSKNKLGESKCDEPDGKPLQPFRRRFQGIRKELNVTATRDSLFICDTCNAVYKNRLSLLDHLNYKCGNSVKNVQCHVCSKTYSSKYTLKQHILYKHERKIAYVCPICGKGLPTASMVSSHISRHRKMSHHRKENDDGTKFRCEECKIEYRHLYQLKHHLKYSVKHASKPMACPQCPRRFMDRYQLMGHIQFRHENKLQTCPLCQKGLAPPNGLKQHMRKVHKIPRKEINITET